MIYDPKRDRYYYSIGFEPDTFRQECLDWLTWNTDPIWSFSHNGVILGVWLNKADSVATKLRFGL